MIVIHIIIPKYPVKESAERGLIFSKYRFLGGIPNKLNGFITVDTFLSGILWCHFIIFIQSNFIHEKTKQVHKNPGHELGEAQLRQGKRHTKSKQRKKSDIKQNAKRIKNKAPGKVELQNRGTTGETGKG